MNFYQNNINKNNSPICYINQFQIGIHNKIYKSRFINIVYFFYCIFEYINKTKNYITFTMVIIFKNKYYIS